MPKKDTSSRNADIFRLRTEEGLTYDQIGARYNLTRERVRQIFEQQRKKQVTDPNQTMSLVDKMELYYEFLTDDGSGNVSIKSLVMNVARNHPLLHPSPKQWFDFFMTRSYDDFRKMKNIGDKKASILMFIQNDINNYGPLAVFKILNNVTSLR